MRDDVCQVFVEEMQRERATIADARALVVQQQQEQSRRAEEARKEQNDLRSQIEVPAPALPDKSLAMSAARRIIRGLLRQHRVCGC